MSVAPLCFLSEYVGSQVLSETNAQYLSDLKKENNFKFFDKKRHHTVE